MNTFYLYTLVVVASMLLLGPMVLVQSACLFKAKSDASQQQQRDVDQRHLSSPQMSSHHPTDGKNKGLGKANTRVLQDSQVNDIVLPNPFCNRTNGSPPTQVPPSLEAMCAVHSALKDIVENALLDDELARSALFGAALRLAFHDSGEIDIRSLDMAGPDGCLSAAADNAGLNTPGSPVVTFLEPLWQDHCHVLSRADFWVLFAKLVVEESDPTKTMDIDFYAGRKDVPPGSDCSAGLGRLPSQQEGLDGLLAVFKRRMGLNTHDVVTLLGAHTIGHVHPEVSGSGRPGLAAKKSPDSPILFNGWDDTPTQFDNGYYVFLLGADWKNKRTAGPVSGPVKSTWLDLGQSTIMLSVDIALGFSPSLNHGAGRPGETCGPRAINGTDGGCVRNTVSKGTLVTSSVPSPFLAKAKKFAEKNDLFLFKFSKAFARMTAVGFSGAESLFSRSFNTSSKLGHLTQMDLKSCSMQ